MTEEPPDFVIDAVFSLADELKSPIPDIEDVVDSVSKSLSQVASKRSKLVVSQKVMDTMLSNSPLPIKPCKVRMENFIESEVHNKITEACNNAIFKQEPVIETEALKSETKEKTGENIDSRPSRKRKPNSMLLSEEYCLNKKEFDELSKRPKNKKQKPVTCQIDHDIIMSVAEKCLPEVLDKPEMREDIKMVSILPPTIDVKISSTQVVIDWKKKVSHPVYREPTRPQTARTKKKLRTQEQIDREEVEIKKKKKLRPKPKSKQKIKSPNPSPPHLEPYGGQLTNIHYRMKSPKSPDHLPPSLQPYEVRSDNKSPIKLSLGQSTSPTMDWQGNTEKDQFQSSEQRIPLSLTGRVRKPNQQYEEYLTNFEKSQSKSSTVKKTALSDENTTINHETNLMQVVTDLKNTNRPPSNSNESSLITSNTSIKSQPSIIKTNVTNVGPRMVISSSSASAKTPVTSTANNKKLTSAIGELAKIENTKKFFQLVVGDKVVLIPTNGDNVVPKAFVMDIAATRPGSQIAPRPRSNQLVSPQKPQLSSPQTLLSRQQKTASMSNPSNMTISQPSSVVSPSSEGKVKQILVMPPSTVVKEEPIPPKTSTELTSLISKMPKTVVSLQSQGVQQTQPPRAPLKNIIIRAGAQQQSIILQNKPPTPSQQSTRLQLVQSPHVIQNMPTLTNVLKGTNPQSILKNIYVNTTTSGEITQKILFPVMSGNKIVSTAKPYPTYMMTNTSNTTSIVPSILRPSIQTTETVSTATKVKDEPNNIKEYEKAAKSFKGVPDDGSDTDSDQETRSAQADRQSKQCNEHVPEVGVHVPATESETSERIRKLKERMKQQQLQVETMRKSLQANKTTDGNETPS